jgi:hypothetical protein
MFCRLFVSKVDSDLAYVNWARPVVDKWKDFMMNKLEEINID